MSQVTAAPPTDDLKLRLARGAQILFEMEQQGNTGDQYRRWLEGWLEMLETYEVADAA